MERILLPATLCVLLAACHTAPPVPELGPVIHYGCSGGEQFDAQYAADGSSAQVTVRGKAATLPPAVTQDGRKFDDSHVSLWNKGDDARLRVAGDLMWQSCRDQAKGTPPGIITGTVAFSEKVALPEKAVMVVKLVDVSLADAPSVTVAEDQTSPSQLPAAYEVQYDATKLQSGHTYAMQATVYDGSTLRFINDTQRRVLVSGPEAGPVQVLVIKSGS